ncbi:hypothetical protein CMMCAS03_08270 [Clavibacter michiganensis subsp. michiganensis]|nr:hypothetical protein CMMCAS03_08270 [Clavibacter michiganensis subsp. michiganensis]
MAASRATAAMPSTPPARRVSARDSPPSAGRIHSWAASFASASSASGREDTKRRSPVAVKAAPASLFAERVRRCGTPPPSAGTTQRAWR